MGDLSLTSSNVAYQLAKILNLQTDVFLKKCSQKRPTMNEDSWLSSQTSNDMAASDE